MITLDVEIKISSYRVGLVQFTLGLNTNILDKKGQKIRTQSMAFIQGIDVCGTGTGRHVMKNSFPENYTRFGGFLLKRPKNPYYSTYDTRLESFREHNWPPGMPQKPEQLAEAGFYYLGYF